MAAAKTVEIYDRITGVHMSVSDETWALMNQSNYGKATDATRKATRDAASKSVQESAAASASNK